MAVGLVLSERKEKSGFHVAALIDPSSTPGREMGRTRIVYMRIVVNRILWWWHKCKRGCQYTLAVPLSVL